MEWIKSKNYFIRLAELGVSGSNITNPKKVQLISICPSIHTWNLYFNISRTFSHNHINRFNSVSLMQLIEITPIDMKYGLVIFFLYLFLLLCQREPNELNIGFVNWPFTHVKSVCAYACVCMRAFIEQLFFYFINCQRLILTKLFWWFSCTRISAIIALNVPITIPSIPLFFSSHHSLCAHCTRTHSPGQTKLIESNSSSCK